MASLFSSSSSSGAIGTTYANKLLTSSSLTPKFLSISQSPSLSLSQSQSESLGVQWKRSYGIRILSSSAGSQMEASIKEKISTNPLVIYSKSWCPYCRNANALFKRIGVEPLVVEMDQLGPSQRQVQMALQRLTRQSTVPYIFIGGKLVGGCSDAMLLHRKGELIPLLSRAGLKVGERQA